MDPSVIASELLEDPELDGIVRRHAVEAASDDLDQDDTGEGSREEGGGGAVSKRAEDEDGEKEGEEEEDQEREREEEVEEGDEEEEEEEERVEAIWPDDADAENPTGAANPPAGSGAVDVDELLRQVHGRDRSK